MVSDFYHHRHLFISSDFASLETYTGNLTLFLKFVQAIIKY